MKMTAGGDWSIGLNQSSANVLSDAKLLQRIGRELRAVFEEVVEEPVPDHLASILDRLEREPPMKADRT